MTTWKDAKFRNIILQDNEGLLTTIEPGQGVHVILMTYYEQTKEATILTCANPIILAKLIKTVLSENPEVGTAMLLESIAELSKAFEEAKKGGPPGESIQ